MRMKDNLHLSGVFAAALTPLDEDGAIAPNDIVLLLDFLAKRGCHGALLHGTTGEGPSFAPDERVKMWQAALEVRQTWPDFHLLAGTGTPSLEESIQLTRDAFDLGFDGVLVLPPYYYRQAGEAGLLVWFSKLIEAAVPTGGVLLGYHIPGVSGVALSIDLLARLKDSFPRRFAGIKDSSSDPEYAKGLGARFGTDLVVFNGNDSLFRLALEHRASGCITAMANLISPALSNVWGSFQHGQVDEDSEKLLQNARLLFETYPPAPALLKFMLHHYFGFPRWALKAPLLALTPDIEADVIKHANRLLALSSP